MKMTKIVRTTADLFFPFCLVFGLYVVIHGHLTPGGGFQGGAVMATGTALLLVARAYDDITGRIRKTALKICEAVGLMLFLVAGLSGIFVGRPFMANWLARCRRPLRNPRRVWPQPRRPQYRRPPAPAERRRRHRGARRPHHHPLVHALRHQGEGEEVMISRLLLQSAVFHRGASWSSWA